MQPTRKNDIKSVKLDPIVSQFDTQQQADNYAKWLTEKVGRVLSSNSKPISHEEVVARAAKRRERLLAGLKDAS